MSSPEPNLRDGSQSRRYWTRGEGAARWIGAAHPWTTLVRLLNKHMTVRDAEGLASNYYKAVFGVWPGGRSKKGSAR